MTSCEFDKKLDELGIQWYQAKEENSFAVKKAKEEEIVVLLYEMINSDSRFRRKKDLYCNVIGIMWEKQDLLSFDPKRSSLSHYLAYKLNKRGYDFIKDEGKLNTAKFISLDQPIYEGDGNEIALEDKLVGNERNEPEHSLWENDRLIEILVLITKVIQHLKGKANNEVRRKYFSLFTTDYITYAIKNEECRLDIRHERDMMNAMESDFLNFYMQSMCCSVADIQQSSLKKYGELVDGEEMIETKLPLSNPVYVSYFWKVLKQSVTDSAISNQKGEYKKQLKELINKM